MPKFPPMGVTAVVDQYDDFLRKMGGMAKASDSTHGALSRMGAIPLAGGIIKGAALATTAIVAIGTAAVGAGIAIGGMLLKIADEATPMLEISAAFEKLTARAGKSADAVLKMWQEATAGTVPAIQLMEIYNTATRLLGDAFTTKLPSAMRLLKTAAEATGQDVTAFTTTFIKGVGRLRVGMLAQLGITIDLNQLTEDYAKAHGMKAEAVSDDIKRTLVYNESIRQLTADVGALMEEGMQADDAFDRLRATMTDANNEVKIAISKAMLPLATKLGQLAKVYVPALVKVFQRRLLPIIEKAAKWFGDFLPKAILKLQIWWFRLSGAMKPVTDFIRDKLGKAWLWLTDTVFPAVIRGIDAVIGWLERNMPGIVAWITNAVLKLREWGQSVADFWNTYVAPKLVAAWDWIQTNVTPKLEAIRSWLAEKIPLASQGLSDFWNTTFGPALLTAWQWIVDNVYPKVLEVWDWLRVNLPVAAKNLSDYYNLVWAPAIQAAWQWIIDNVGPLVQDVVDWLVINIPVAVDIAIEKWNEMKVAFSEGASEWRTTTLPALLEIANALAVKLAPVVTIVSGVLAVLFSVFKTLMDWIVKVCWPTWVATANLISAVVGKAFQGLAWLWLNYLLPAAEALWKAIETFLLPFLEDVRDVIDDIGQFISPLVGWVNDLAEAIRGIGVPKALQQNSPSPLEKSLMGVKDQMLAINALGLPGFPSKAFSPVVAGPGASAMGSVGGATSNFNLTVNSSAPRESVIADYGLMRALARRR